MNPWAKKTEPEIPSPAEVQSSVRVAIAANEAADEFVADVGPEVIPAENPDRIEKGKLSKLISDDFPFDESQLVAIDGMTQHRFACLTGAAGTGKTTCTKKIVDILQSQTDIDAVDMSGYWKSSSRGDAEDDYQMPESWIPAIALVGFTGRSTQMIKRNFPRDWHGNIMTIHRLLGFAPEYYQDMDEESGEFKNKMRFAPTYGPGLLMPWDIILIDEAGMVGLDLWHQLYDAMKPGCRVYMIGDINQLPPVHGRSVFGFAMDKWPSFELTHIHRQQGENNAIVDNAWRILKGQMPVSEGRFQMVELKGDAQGASRHVRGIMPKLMERGIYEPNRDTIITPINGEDGSRGYALGQLPLNAEFSLIFNPTSTHPRYVIDGGRVKQRFAVGDKVMATKNDYEAGITNGMTGIIKEIFPNPGYGGDHHRFGLITEVTKWLEAEDDDEDEVDFTLEELESDFEAQSLGKEARKEKQERGPASHTVVVRFGTEDQGFDLPFGSFSEVGSLMTAYVVTCHKMQGGESPVIVVICHDAHKAMMYREWLYTAVTRASEKCILLYTPTALKTALNKQKIKGTTLKEKVHAFNLLQRDNGLGVAVNVRLPGIGEFTDESLGELVQSDSGSELVVGGDRDLDPEPDRVEVTQVQEKVVETAAPKETLTQHHHHHHYFKEVVFVPTQPKPAPIEPEPIKVKIIPTWMRQKRVEEEVSKRPKLEDFAEQPWAWPAEWSESNAVDTSGHSELHIPATDLAIAIPPKVNTWAARLAAARKG